MGATWRSPFPRAFDALSKAIHTRHTRPVREPRLSTRRRFVVSCQGFGATWRWARGLRPRYNSIAPSTRRGELRPTLGVPDGRSCERTLVSALRACCEGEDASKLITLVTEINRLLEEKEQRLKAKAEQPGLSHN